MRLMESSGRQPVPAAPDPASTNRWSAERAQLPVLHVPGVTPNLHVPVAYVRIDGGGVQTVLDP